MSYAIYWDCPSLDPKTWTEDPEIECIPNRRFAVSVRHGENCAVDDLYLFATFEDAETFYSKDVERRQYKIDGRLLGFQSVALIETTHDIVLAERKVRGRRTAHARRAR